MKDIKRFHEGGYGTTEMKLSDFGDWVLYDDHAEMVAALQQQVRAADMTIRNLSQYKEAYGEYYDKTSWVQTDKRFDVLNPWGKHRADVLHEYITIMEEQVRALAAEANYLRNEIKQHSASVHFCEVCGKEDPCKTDDVCWSLNHPLPSTDAVIREIRALAVDDFGIYHNFSDKKLIQDEAKKYAAAIRAGEQP